MFLETTLFAGAAGANKRTKYIYFGIKGNKSLQNSNNVWYIEKNDLFEIV